MDGCINEILHNNSIEKHLVTHNPSSCPNCASFFNVMLCECVHVWKFGNQGCAVTNVDTLVGPMEA